jgi:hypothetical protein
MKANHVSIEERLKTRIVRLYSKLGNETEPIGKPNPYYKCVGCGRSMPEVSISGHLPGCRVVGLKNEIKYYENLLGNMINA